jgi:hypothetical protein
MDTALLVASHVIPWAIAPDARGDLANIICLCRFHDALFEVGYFSLTDNCAVLHRPLIKSTTVRSLLPGHLSFRFPREFPPNPAYLSIHRERHGFSA